MLGRLPDYPLFLKWLRAATYPNQITPSNLFAVAFTIACRRLSLPSRPYYLFSFPDSLFSIFYFPFPISPSHSTLYSNLPFFLTQLPVIYGKHSVFEPLFKTLILIYSSPPGFAKSPPSSCIS